MMKNILAEFYRSQLARLIRYAVIVALCVIMFVFTGIFSSERTLIAGIAVTAFLGAVLLLALAEVFVIAPARFRKLTEQLSDSEREQLLGGCEKAKALGRWRFTEEYFLFFSRKGIEVIRYADIQSLSTRGNDILLTLNGGRTAALRPEGEENPAIIMAYLRGQNPEIKVKRKDAGK